MVVKWSVLAQEDLDQIMLYIAQDNAQRAISFTYELWEEVEKLKCFPMRGVRVPERSENHRVLHYKGYTIYYLLEEDTVVVLEVCQDAKAKRRITLLRNDWLFQTHQYKNDFNFLMISYELYLYQMSRTG